MNSLNSVDLIMDKLLTLKNNFLPFHTHSNLVSNHLDSPQETDELNNVNLSPSSKFNLPKVFESHSLMRSSSILTGDSSFPSYQKLPFLYRSMKSILPVMLDFIKSENFFSVPSEARRDNKMLGKCCVNMTIPSEIKFDDSNDPKINVMVCTSSSESSNGSVLANSKKLNSELVSRKTKELLKRSKKRRRRQKKLINSTGNASKIPQSQVCVEISVGKVSSPQCKNTESSSCDKKVEICSEVPSTAISSFFIAVESASDDDSDWESTSNLSNHPYFEFEVTGLCIANLAPHIYSVQSERINCDISNSQNNFKDSEVQDVLRKVNSNWNKDHREFNSEPKIPSKVTFAADNDLTEVFPVEIYDRKGEWEIYAIERMRFKRRIDEVEKILAPCLTPSHRSRMFQRLCASESQQ